MMRRAWDRNELILALSLYCRLPFGRYHSRNSEIVHLAQRLNRTPDAVAMKLSNFASMDPYHQSRGIRGLQNASRGDREIWDEFTTNWDALAVESELIAAQYPIETVIPTEDAHIHTPEKTETQREVRVRIGQEFFRRVVLTSYAEKCCICGLPVPALLVASHIIPWSEDANLRVNPHNGLCLCTLHDKGFDRGLVTIGESYEIIVGRKLLQHLPNVAIEQRFMAYDGQIIQLPDKFLPDQTFLSFHRSYCFEG